MFTDAPRMPERTFTFASVQCERIPRLLDQRGCATETYERRMSVRARERAEDTMGGGGVCVVCGAVCRCAGRRREPDAMCVASDDAHTRMLSGCGDGRWCVHNDGWAVGVRRGVTSGGARGTSYVRFGGR